MQTKRAGECGEMRGRLGVGGRGKEKKDEFVSSFATPRRFSPQETPAFGNGTSV